MKSGIYGAWAYKVSREIEEGEKFPREGDKYVCMIGGKYGSLDEVRKEFIERAKRLGANVIAIGKGDGFDIYEVI